MSQNKQNILLIDDDTEDHEIFTSALDEITPGLNYTTFTDARDALSLLNAKALTADIIFLDLNMPIMTGQEFLVAIKEIPHLEHIPVVIFSTSANPTTIEMTKLLGASDFITKPGKFSDLVTILRPFIVTP